MTSLIPALAVGAVLEFLAVGLAYREWSVWNSGPSHLPEDDPARDFALRQFRRRFRVSLLTALLGILIPLGDIYSLLAHIPPLLFAIHWLAVLGIVVVIVLIALGDLAASLADLKTARAELKRERQTLEAELRRYQAERRGNNGAALPEKSADG